jgi:hypothetical protein
MSRIPWHFFQDHQPRAHLVVGTIIQAEGPAGLEDSTAALAALRHLATQQKPVSDYAATVIREAGWPELYFAFDDEADAQKFEPIESYPGWASQRAFEIDSAKVRELEAALPPVDTAKTPCFPRRVSRGPWARIRRYDDE